VLQRGERIAEDRCDKTSQKGCIRSSIDILLRAGVCEMLVEKPMYEFRGCCTVTIVQGDLVPGPNVSLKRRRAKNTKLTLETNRSAFFLRDLRKSGKASFLNWLISTMQLPRAQVCTGYALKVCRCICIALSRV
jgi:hypothetical protein